LGSRTKIKILRALHRHSGKEFTIRELADFIGVSHTGVRKALDDLYEMNAITLQAVGNSHTVNINSSSHLLSLMDTIFEYEEETLNHLVESIRESICGKGYIKRVSLFGSVARMEEEPRSDIDLLILTDDKERAEETVSQLQPEISRRFGNPLAPYILTPGEADEPSSAQLMKEISERCITVCDRQGEANGVNENQERPEGTTRQPP
jgi:predicted nucleotidyltransferase